LPAPSTLITSSGFGLSSIAEVVLTSSRDLSGSPVVSSIGASASAGSSQVESSKIEHEAGVVDNTPRTSSPARGRVQVRVVTSV
jgi:hypothetical protein